MSKTGLGFGVIETLAGPARQPNVRRDAVLVGRLVGIATIPLGKCDGGSGPERGGMSQGSKNRHPDEQRTPPRESQTQNWRI